MSHTIKYNNNCIYNYILRYNLCIRIVYRYYITSVIIVEYHQKYFTIHPQHHINANTNTNIQKNVALHTNKTRPHLFATRLHVCFYTYTPTHLHTFT